MINIYVGNLPYTTSEGDLETLFGQFGTVLRTSIIMDRETGRSRGFGFVEMSDVEEGRKAIEALAGQPYNGRPLTINEAKPREPRKGGFSGGAYGRPTGGGYSNQLSGGEGGGYANRGSGGRSGYSRPDADESDEGGSTSGYSGGYGNQRYSE